MANRCVYDGKEYSDGAELCQGGKIMKCRDGSWEDTGENCDSVRAASAHSLRVSPSFTESDGAAGLRREGLMIVSGGPTTKGSSCCFYFAIGSVTKVGLRNKCDQCKMAVINFIYGNGRHEIKKFRVEAKSQTEVDISGTQMTEIIDDEPCK